VLTIFFNYLTIIYEKKYTFSVLTIFFNYLTIIYEKKN